MVRGRHTKSYVWWLIAIIPALKKLKEEDWREFQASVSYSGRLSQTKHTKLRCVKKDKSAPVSKALPLGGHARGNINFKIKWPLQREYWLLMSGHTLA